MTSIKKTIWPKPSSELIDILDKHMSRFTSEKRNMFGCPCYFINGNMFAGIFSDGLFARFSPRDRDHLDKLGLGADFEPVEGRKMREYRTLTKRVLETPGELDRWLMRAYSYASRLEPKRKRKR